MSRGFRCVVAYLVVATAACSSTVYETGAPPPSIMSESPPDSVQLGLRGGRVLMLARPSVQADTIWGDQADGQHVGAAIKDVEWGLARSNRHSDRRSWVVGLLTAGLVLEVWVIVGVIQALAHGN